MVKSWPLTPNRVFYHWIRKYCSFIYQMLKLELIQEYSLFNYFIYSFCSTTLFLYVFSFDIWRKFPGTRSFKNLVISLWSLINWPLYAALLLFFFDRTLYPEGASSPPLRNIPAERQLKSQTKNKLLSYQPPKQKYQNFITTLSQHAITLMSLFNLHFFNFTFY